MRIAAIDIGSNSLHLLIVRADPTHRFHVLHKEKKMIRLGSGSLQSGKIPTAAADRALRALRRFSGKCRKYEVDEITAVATSAIRESQNRQHLLERVRRETGIVVRVLSGEEEGRLIALAVSRFNRSHALKDLIIDIGGGSTELIVTSAGKPSYLNSLKLGSVRLTERFLESDPPAREELAQLRRYVRRLLEEPAASIRAEGFDRVVGTSGTIRALARMCLWTGDSPGDLRRAGLAFGTQALQDLNRRLCKLALAQRSELPGLPGRRADIIVAGGLLLEETMAAIGLDRLTTCPWALREGVLLSSLRANGLLDARWSTRPMAGKLRISA
ncbi:MAG: Ppx/GppA family phosphatase [Acidobacteria bacterium]|nr:Ppx/GppA family phosphatase [Acidobacteriota bacterium]